MTDRTLYKSISRGDTFTIIPGVYVARAAWPSDVLLQHQVRTLARQMLWPHLVGSHESAALVNRLPLLDTGVAAARSPRFTREPGPGVRSSRNPRVTVRPLPHDAVTNVAAGITQGLRVTSPARTAVDLAAELPLPEALMVTDVVARQSLLGFRGHRSDDPLSPLAVDSDSGLAGASGLSSRAYQAAIRPLEMAVVAPAHCSAAVEQTLALTSPLRESPAESNSFGWFVVAGLPLPQCQVALDTDLGVFRVDFYWEEFDLVGECDGALKYDGSQSAGAAVMVQQSAREQALRDRGHFVVRWSAAEMMYRPDLVLARIEARLRGCGWNG